MPELSSVSAVVLRGAVPVWAAIVLAVGGTWLVARGYRRGPRFVPLGRRTALAAVRAAALVSVLFLALRPTVVSDIPDPRRRPVVVLADDSKSMLANDLRPTPLDRWRAAVAFGKVPPGGPPAAGSADAIPDGVPDRPTRLDVMKAALANGQMRLLDRLAELGPVQPFAFGRRAVPADPRGGGWVARLSGDEPQTALADVLADVLADRAGADLPAAVVVATDGRDTASGRTLADVAAEYKRRNVPVFVYGVGGAAGGRVRITDLAVPDPAFVADSAAVGVRFRVTDVPPGAAKVQLVARLGEAEVARKLADLGAGPDQRETLTFVPTAAQAAGGRQELSVAVRLIGADVPAADETARGVRVVDRKIRVLCVDSAPRWDFTFVQRALLRDRRVDARFLLTDADPRAMRSGPPFVPAFPGTRAELFGYDLVVLGDVPAAALTADQRGWVREFVADGGGLVHPAGRAAPAGWAGTPLADVLPVAVPARRAADDPPAAAGFRPQLTPAGARSPLLALADADADNRRAWADLPELYWAHPVDGLKPAADALAVHPTAAAADGTPLPVIAAHHYGRGYVVYVGTDETWRWRFNAADAVFGRFWSQAVYAAGAARAGGGRRTRLALDAADPQLGQVGRVYARLLAADLTPVRAAAVPATLTRLDGHHPPTPVVLSAVPGRPGEYSAAVPFDRLGRFALAVDDGDGTAVEYRVGPPAGGEQSAGPLAEAELRGLAEATGGRYFREEDLAGLPDAVTPRAASVPRRVEYVLWDEWALLWVTGLLTVEWVLRRWHALA